MINQLARRIIRVLIRPDRIANAVESEIKAKRRAAVPRAATGPSGVFTDARGNPFQLDPAHRDRLKPGWRVSCDPSASLVPPTREAQQSRARKAAANVQEARRIVDSVAPGALAGSILEVGCYDGAAAFQLALLPGTTVVASDMAEYYVVQLPGVPDAALLPGQQQRLADLRERARAVAGVDKGRVLFVEDDITSSSLEAGSFDVIVSFEVLEHVRNPGDALAAMARLLRPGGVMYHDYNPFFAINGGHSLCTLDFPWGHARLEPADVERYFAEIRPSERDQDLRFFTQSLNRMTHADLRRHVADAGLELLALVPWADRSLPATLPDDVVAQVRRAYPSAGVEDLLATFVSVVARRPLLGTGGA